MTNNIKKYRDFLFEEDSVDTAVNTSRLEMSKIQDEGRNIKNKYDAALDAAGKDQSKRLQAESQFLAGKIQIYQKMIPAMTNLKAKLDQKISEIKG